MATDAMLTTLAGPSLAGSNGRTSGPKITKPSIYIYINMYMLLEVSMAARAAPWLKWGVTTSSPEMQVMFPEDSFFGHLSQGVAPTNGVLRDVAL